MAEVEFLAPNYYKDFKCKCGECRKTCCVGWTISISMQEYFNLIGVECSKKLRDKLDSAFSLAIERSPEHYATLNSTLSGDCPMRKKNGFCAIQCELGESVLPDVCKFYPRSPRFVNGYEVCLSNSCEKVIEMLFNQNSPIYFEKVKCDFDFPLPSQTLPKNDDLIRKYCIEITESDKFNTDEKIRIIGKFLAQANICANVQTAISETEKTKTSNEIENFGERIKYSAYLLSEFGIHSASINDYTEKTFINLGDGKNEINLKKYVQAENLLIKKYPDIDLKLRNILANHLFYEKFPFTDKNLSFYGEFIALCSLCLLLKILLVGNINKNSDINTMIDVLSETFRLIEHTNFYKNSSILAEEYGIKTIEDMLKIF